MAQTYWINFTEGQWANWQESEWSIFGTTPPEMHLVLQEAWALRESTIEDELAPDETVAVGFNVS